MKTDNDLLTFKDALKVPLNLVLTLGKPLLILLKIGVIIGGIGFLVGVVYFTHPYW